MELKLIRQIFTDNSTVGTLYINGEKQCYTLEDLDRELNDGMNEHEITQKKVYGKTAIPYGKYEVVITYSNNFKQYMPLLLGVKGFSGIRIHSGNTDADSLGCILVGNSIQKDFIGESRKAYQTLFAKLQKAVKQEKIFIEIVKQ